MDNYMFFVMLTMDSGTCLPLTKEDGDMAMFQSAEDARKEAEENLFGQHFGYEIFQRGEGIF